MRRDRPQLREHRRQSRDAPVLGVTAVPQPDDVDDLQGDDLAGSDKGDPHLVLTLWRDRAAAEAYEVSGAAAEVVALVRGFFAAPPTLSAYESSSAL